MVAATFYLKGDGRGVTLVDPYLEALHRQVQEVVAGLGNEQMLRHPPGKWCAAEILEHLYLTYTGSIKAFQRVLASDKPLAGKPTWKNRAQALIVVGFGYMPNGREAPSQARPRGVPADTVSQNIAAEIVKMDDLITQCEQRFGRSVRVLDHPILGPFTTSQWRKFHLVHGQHHLEQIRKLRKIV